MKAAREAEEEAARRAEEEKEKEQMFDFTLSIEKTQGAHVHTTVTVLKGLDEVYKRVSSIEIKALEADNITLMSWANAEIRQALEIAKEML